MCYYRGMTGRQSKVVAKMVENGSISGKELKEIGYSDAIVKAPSKVTRSRAVQSELQRLLKKRGITLDKALAPIAKALQATKSEMVVTAKGDHIYTTVDDIEMQLKGSDRALKLLNMDKPKHAPEQAVAMDTEAIRELLAEGNLVELQRVLLQKS